MGIGNESLITRGRNTIISYFHKLQDFTHLFFMDADIGITANALIQLLSRNEDIIGAPVPLKGHYPDGSKVYNVTPMPGVRTDTELVEVLYIGTAALLISRKAATALIEASEGYSKNALTRGVNMDIRMYDCFKTKIVDDVYLSEDYYACDKWRELGFKVYVDQTITDVQHNGMFKF